MIDDAFDVAVHTRFAALLVFIELWSQELIDLDLHVVGVELRWLDKDTNMADTLEAFFAHSDCVAKLLLSAEIFKGGSVEHRCEHVGHGVGFDVWIGTDLKHSQIARVLAFFDVSWLKIVDVTRPQPHDFDSVEAIEVQSVELGHWLLRINHHLKCFFPRQVTLNEPLHVELVQEILFHLEESVEV